MKADGQKLTKNQRKNGGDDGGGSPQEGGF
jgi:hypothetical protein